MKAAGTRLFKTECGLETRFPDQRYAVSFTTHGKMSDGRFAFNARNDQWQQTECEQPEMQASVWWDARNKFLAARFVLMHERTASGLHIGMRHYDFEGPVNMIEVRQLYDNRTCAVSASVDFGYLAMQREVELQRIATDHDEATLVQLLIDDHFDMILSNKLAICTQRDGVSA